MVTPSFLMLGELTSTKRRLPLSSHNRGLSIDGPNEGIQDQGVICRRAVNPF
jgi:hypothetical protein